MRVTKHYIEELKAGSWRWTHVQQGGILPVRGPIPQENGQIIINDNKYTVNSSFDHTTISPRPGWALGLVAIGFIGLLGAAQTAQYALGSVIFGLFGLLAIIAGIMSYSKSFHIYAMFSEGTAMQIPPIRKWIDREQIDEAIGFTSDAIALDAKSQLGREILNPNVPWGLIIMAAIAGLGGGALIGVVVAHIR